MQLSDESVARFIEVYKEEYGEELSVGEARIMATNLINLYRVILQPLPKEELPQRAARRKWIRREPAGS